VRIAVWHNLPSGGGKRALFYHVRGLLERGHNVESWCPPSADQEFLPLNDITREHVVALEPVQSQVQGGMRGRLRKWRQRAMAFERMVRHCRLCAAEISLGHFDVLFANSCRFNGVAPIGRCLQIPKVLYLQEPYRTLYEAMPGLPWRAPTSVQRAWTPHNAMTLIKDLIKVQALRAQAREEWSSARAFDVILVNSFFSRESILRVYGLEARVCYLGVDTEKFRPSNVQKEQIVVGLGNIDSNKRVSRAIRALATIEKSRRPVLVWIGNYTLAAYEASVRALATSLGVTFVPKVAVSDNELIDLLSRASVMLYTPRLEPFGLAVLEANACGTGVVAIAEGGVRESVVDGVNGFLVPNGEPEELGRAVLQFLESPEFSRRIGQTARRHVEKNWSLVAAVERLEMELFRAAQNGAKTND